MESFSESVIDHLQALDFTSSFKREPTTETPESPILDLSCKKSSSPTSSEPNTNTILSGSRSNSPVTTEKHQEIVHIADSERKSPFEGRTFMVTPPSESDSPKKIKYEPIYNCSTGPSNGVTNQHGGFSVLPMNIPIPVVPTAIPPILAQNSGTVKPVQMVGPSTTLATASSTLAADSGKRAPRPFKAYPKDPLSLTMGTAELMYDQNSNEAYSEFRKRMLDSVRKSNEGTNVKMRRITKSPTLPTSIVDEKDAAYWERRRKNNEAAKRSRDARRAKEDEIAIRAAFLEQENIKLKYELVALRNETAKLRCMVYST